MMFFEEARQRAEVDHRSNPKDAQVRYPNPDPRHVQPFYLQERELLFQSLGVDDSQSPVLPFSTLRC